MLPGPGGVVDAAINVYAEIPAGPSTLQPSSSTKPAASHPAPGWEDGDERNDYKYNDNNIDWVAGPTMWGWESKRTGKKRDCHCHLDPPLPTPPTSTFPGGRRCPPMA